jgi:gluconate 2-dehydrogenase gamma chain
MYDMLMLSMHRRTFVAASAVSAVSSCRRPSPSPWRTLSDSEAQTLGVLCGEIVPADDQPGAEAAGAVRFLDLQLTKHYRKYRGTYRQGAVQAEAISTRKFGRLPEKLAPAERLAFAKDVERSDPAFFSMLVAHTMQSFYGSPRHGGNREAVSWRMLGVPPVQVRGRGPA